MARVLLSVDDLAQGDVRRILAHAAKFGSTPRVPGDSGALVGLVFLETSLRTRVGFAAAAARLGWQSIDVTAPRSSATSMAESWQDTLRTVSGFVDVVIARLGRPLDPESVERCAAAPFLNAGDTGSAAEHPSQALIDLFAIEQEAGPVTDLCIAICGDIRMRAVRSLLKLLARTPPKKVVLVTSPALVDIAALPPTLAGRTEFRSLLDLADIDVLYVAGMPHGALPLDERVPLLVGPEALSGLASDAIVLSPLPVIDEIDAAARSDRRIRMFQQSDRSVFVRMAILEFLSGR